MSDCHIYGNKAWQQEVGKVIAKPEAPAPEPQYDSMFIYRCMQCGCTKYGDKVCSFNCVCHDLVPATAAPSQPAREWLKATRKWQEFMLAIRRLHMGVYPSFHALMDTVEPYFAAFTAAKDAQVAELKYRISDLERELDDMTCLQNTAERSFGEQWKLRVAAERERDSLRAERDAIADDYQDLGKELAQLVAENAAMKAGKDEQQ